MLSKKHLSLTIKNLPNYLTFFRIFLVPFFVISFFYEFLINKNNCADYFLGYSFFIFFIACITDFLDGYLARELKCSSKIGQILDPLADKILVVTTLILLMTLQKINSYNNLVVLIIILRDLIVSSFKNNNNPQKTLYLSKVKTSLQMLALGCLILFNNMSFIYLGLWVLWVSALLSVISGVQYLKNFKY